MRTRNFNIHSLKRFFTLKKVFICLLFLFLLISGSNTKNVFAQESKSVLYVPLIGITSVPDPLALPNGSGTVLYRYAVKNFVSEVALTNVQVIDDMCSPVKFITGDDNGDSKLDYAETWRYSCSTTLNKTTQSTATAIGMSNNLTATHRAFATVVVGSNSPPPLISIINTTKIPYPLSSTKGSTITFTYKVNNPGSVALSNVEVTDNKCSPLSSKLGDINGNNLLDMDEVWIYTCTATLTQTITDTTSVVGFANGLKAGGETTVTINVDSPNVEAAPLFDIVISPLLGKGGLKTIVWEILSAILMILIIYSVLTRKHKLRRIQNKSKSKRNR